MLVSHTIFPQLLASFPRAGGAGGRWGQVLAGASLAPRRAAPVFLSLAPRVLSARLRRSGEAEPSAGCFYCAEASCGVGNPQVAATALCFGELCCGCCAVLRPPPVPLRGLFGAGSSGRCFPVLTDPAGRRGFIFLGEFDEVKITTVLEHRGILERLKLALLLPFVDLAWLDLQILAGIS